MINYTFQILPYVIGARRRTNLSGNRDNYEENGQYNFQDAFNFNRNNINPLYNSSEKASDTYLYSSINNHFGMGLINCQLSDKQIIYFSGGIDLRYYKGEHYREVYDLLGGEYVVDEGNNLLQESQIKRLVIVLAIIMTA